AELPVGPAGGRAELLGSAPIAAPSMDPAKCRVAKSSQRTGLARRGEAKRNFKLRLRLVEVFRIGRPASPADQESRPSLVTLRLLRHRELDRLLSKRQGCLRPARQQRHLSKTYQQSRLVRYDVHLFGVADSAQCELQPLL